MMKGLKRSDYLTILGLRVLLLVGVLGTWLELTAPGTGGG